MNITVIGVNKANVMDLIHDKDVYVIKQIWSHRDQLGMIPIKDADVSDLMSDNVLIVKVTRE